MRTILTKLALATVVTAMGLAAIPASASGPKIATQAAIKAENDRWSEAFKRGDYEAIGQLYTEDGTLLQPDGQRVRGKDAIVKYFTEGYTGKPPVTVSFSNFEFYGNDEAVTEISDAIIKNAEGKVEYSGKQILIFLKQGGVWKLHRDMWNSNGPM